MIVALAHLGRIEEARSQVERMISTHPEITIGSFRKAAHYVSHDDMEHYSDELRKAGVPE